LFCGGYKGQRYTKTSLKEFQGPSSLIKLKLDVPTCCLSDMDARNNQVTVQLSQQSSNPAVRYSQSVSAFLLQTLTCRPFSVVCSVFSERRGTIHFYLMAVRSNVSCLQKQHGVVCIPTFLISYHVTAAGILRGLFPLI
jgi:hypothetical protein